MSPVIALIALAVLLVPAGVAQAGEARVEAVRPVETGDGTWRFDVTVRHADEGWDHYANAFTVATVEGEVLGTRVLLHPHVSEQPFTRSLASVAVPDGVDVVLVRAVDSVHGEGEAVRVELPR